MRIIIWNEDNEYFYGEIDNDYVRVWNQTNDLFYYGHLYGTEFRIHNEYRGWLRGRIEGTELIFWDENNNYMWGRIEP